MKEYNAEKFKSGIKFLSEDNTSIANIEFFQGEWETIEIPDGYEIIGLYGCASEEFLTSLGFIIWIPNPFAV